MAILLRIADLDADRGPIIDVLSRFLTKHSDDRRFDWLYRDCPQGKAIVWIATDESTGSIVGIAACFPRKVIARGIERRACVLGDFCVHPQYRSLGPALRLQRACLQHVDSGTFEFAFDFPSASMLAVYRRLHVEPRAQLVRLAKPLRIDRKVRDKVKSRSLARALSRAGNQALAWRDRAFTRGGHEEISLHEDLCGGEFSELARRGSTSHALCVERSAEYLNWRYRCHPFRRYDILVARREGDLVGFAIVTREGGDVTIVDLFGLQDEAMLGRLIAGVVLLARERGAMTLNAPILASHSWRALFEMQGFRPREAHPVVIYTPHSSPDFHSRGVQLHWHLMDADRES